MMCLTFIFLLFCFSFVSYCTGVDVSVVSATPLCGSPPCDWPWGGVAVLELQVDFEPTEDVAPQAGSLHMWLLEAGEYLSVGSLGIINVSLCGVGAKVPQKVL